MKTLGIIVIAVALMLAVQTVNADTLIFSNPEIASVANPAPAGTIWPAGPGGAVGGIGGPTNFNLASAGQYRFDVLDCCLVGDVYEFFVDGANLGMTAPVPIGGPVLSTGSFFINLAAGAHTYDVWDIVLSYIGVASPFGGGVVPAGYSPAGLTVQCYQVVPIPASLTLLASGLLGFAIPALRRRK